MMRLDARPHNVFYEYRDSPFLRRPANHFLCFWEEVIIGSGGYAHPVLRDACIDIVFINDAPPIVVGPWNTEGVALFISVLAKQSKSITAGRPVRCIWTLDGSVAHLEAAQGNEPSIRARGLLRMSR